jgi:hypothetical protein
MSILGLGTSLELEVGGKKLQDAILETIVANALTLTAQGSSTIATTAKDPQRLLAKSGWFSSKAEAFLDGLPFVACAFKKKVDEFTLEFEDRDFWMMKEGPHARDPVKVVRGHKTLQEFVKEQTQRLCPHTDFVCPQLKQVQPREPEKITSNTKGARSEPAPGISGGFDIEGTPADAEQKKMAGILLEACTGSPPIVAVAIICAALGESTLRNPKTPNSKGYWGVLQGGSGAAGSAPNFPSTPNDQTAKEMAECFVKGGRGFQAGGAAALARSGKTDPGEIATLVEGSGEPADYYGKFKGEAEAIIKAYGVNPGSSTAKTTTTITPEFFELNQKVNTDEEPEEEDESEENALSGLESLLKPGKWLFWKVGNTFYLYTERYLARCKPVVQLSEDTPGIFDIGYELDHSKKKVSKVIIECRALLWEVPPGQVVSFDDSVGEEISRDSDGKVRRWIVLNIERKDITDNATTVELILPEQGKKEKGIVAKELTVVSLNGKTGNRETQNKPAGTKGEGQLKENSILYNALYQMHYIAAQEYPYVWGGGHNDTFTASGSSGPAVAGAFRAGYDCSGVLSSVLHAAGIMAFVSKGELGGVGGRAVVNQVGEAQDSTWFETWGEAGRGKYMTVWANGDHCFIEVNVPASFGAESTGGKTLFFVARQKGTIVGFFDSETTEGFTPRHWPGT